MSGRAAEPCWLLGLEEELLDEIFQCFDVSHSADEVALLACTQLNKVLRRISLPHAWCTARCYSSKDEAPDVLLLRPTTFFQRNPQLTKYVKHLYLCGLRPQEDRNMGIMGVINICDLEGLLRSLNVVAELTLSNLLLQSTAHTSSPHSTHLPPLPQLKAVTLDAVVLPFSNSDAPSSVLSLPSVDKLALIDVSWPTARYFATDPHLYSLPLPPAVSEYYSRPTVSMQLRSNSRSMVGLKKLHLHEMTPQAQPIAGEIIRKHSRTLTSVALGQMEWMEGASWDDLGLRSCTKLKTFTLDLLGLRHPTLAEEDRFALDHVLPQLPETLQKLRLRFSASLSLRFPGDEAPYFSALVVECIEDLAWTSIGKALYAAAPTTRQVEIQIAGKPGGSTFWDTHTEFQDQICSLIAKGGCLAQVTFSCREVDRSEDLF